MAIVNFNLVINYDSADQPRIVAALIARYSISGFVPTQAQAIEAYRQDVMKNIKQIVLGYEQGNAMVGVTQVNTFQ